MGTGDFHSDNPGAPAQSSRGAGRNLHSINCLWRCPAARLLRAAGLLLALTIATVASAAEPELLAQPSAQWLGAASCSARACHGSPGEQRANPIVWGNEHTIWREHDNHQQAYAALLTPRSQEMAQRLQLKQPAHEARQCLVCHAPAALDRASSPPIATCVPTFVTEGVGCESCHGPAQRWIAAHTAADWSLLTLQEKERDFGFRNSKDLTARAELCISCHVGSGEADVNHDLIAAGHPRLTFEFASHLHRMPLHWDEQRENNRQTRPDYEARVWTIGQIAAAQAQLNLLAARADAAARDRPGAVWPEFAEYSCYACHRHVGGESHAVVAGRLGQPAWGAWYNSMLPLVGHAPEDVDVRLAALRKRMENLAADPATVSVEAHRSAAAFDGWLAAAAVQDFNESQLRARLTQLAQEGPVLVDGDWDTAAQLYLALVAFQQARLDVRQQVSAEDRSIARLLGQTRRALRHPATGLPGDFAESIRGIERATR